jgi:alpha-tubulin suppressor-like RCC1 family protein
MPSNPADLYLPRSPVPQPVWKTLVVGERFQCGRDMADMVWCFGENGRGQNGTGVQGNILGNQPQKVTVVDTWTSLDAGSLHACGVRGGGYVVSCWGDNTFGQLGNPAPGLSTTPVTVTARF